MYFCYAFWISGGRGTWIRTLAGAFEPIFTMTGTRAVYRSGVACTALGLCGGTRRLASALRWEHREVSRSQVNASREEVL
jgi:hypothetical protein